MGQRFVARTGQAQQTREYQRHCQQSTPGPWPFRADVENPIRDPAGNANHNSWQSQDSGQPDTNPRVAVLFEFLPSDWIHAINCGGNSRAGKSYASPTTFCSPHEMSLMVTVFLREFPEWSETKTRVWG